MCFLRSSFLAPKALSWGQVRAFHAAGRWVFKVSLSVQDRTDLLLCMGAAQEGRGTWWLRVAGGGCLLVWQRPRNEPAYLTVLCTVSWAHGLEFRNGMGEHCPQPSGMANVPTQQEQASGTTGAPRGCHGPSCTTPPSCCYIGDTDALLRDPRQPPPQGC